MTHYIVRFRGSAPARAIVERLNDAPDITVIEETPRMVLVDASEEVLRALVGDAPGVVIVPERHYERPIPPLKTEKE